MQRVTVSLALVLAVVMGLTAALPGRAEVLFRDDFKNLEQWDIHDYKNVGKDQKSVWQVTGGKLHNTSHIKNTEEDWKANQNVDFGTNVVTKQSFTDATFRCTVKENDYLVLYGLIFRYTDENNYYRLDFNTDGGMFIVVKDGKVTKVPLPDNFCYVMPDIGTYVDLTCVGEKFTVSINGDERLSFCDDTHPAGRFGFFTVQKDGVFFSQARVFSGLPPRPEVKLAITKPPYLFWCTGSEARLAWETNIPGKTHIVEYGHDGKFDQKVDATTNVLVHQAVLTGLKAGQKYRYRCLTDGIPAGEGEFTADPGLGKPVVFGLLGDSQYSPDRTVKFNRLMMKENPQILLHVGDCVGYGNKTNWDYELFNPNETVMPFVPYFITIGNHEVNSKYFSYYLPYPETNNKRGHYYAARYGCVAFLSFDDFHLTDEQFKWFEETLASPMFQQADWRIVFSHKPPYCAGWDTYPGEEWKRGEKFMGLLKKYDVHFLFNGHTHTHERGMIDNVCHIIAGGVAGGENFGRMWDHVDVYTLDLHCGVCKVTPKRAEITFIGIDGKQIDRLVLEKGKSYYLDATPVLVKHPDAQVTGNKFSFVVHTPALGDKLLKYKVSYDLSVDTYQWTKPAAASSPVELTIEPKKPGNYRVRIVGMDEDGHVTQPVIHEVEVLEEK